MHHLLVANLRGKSRLEIMNEAQYLVAPLSMIVPGILNGSRGPLLYPLEELKRQPSDWNHIPIVLYHPQRDGQPISAKDPAVLNASQLGILLNARAEEKLVAEGWFHVENTKRIAPQVWRRLEREEPVELSTGLSLDVEPTPGEFNGVAYQAIARNYRPDHLAVLPDQVGACSVKDGCGVMVNQNISKLKESTMTKLNDDQRKGIVDHMIANCDCWTEGDREVLNTLTDEKLTSLKQHVDDYRQSEAVANAARQGFENGDVGFTFNEKELKFEGKPKVVAPPEVKKEEPTVNTEAKKPITAEEWMAAAPPEIQSVVRNAMESERAQKETLVKTITANKQNIFKAEQLMAKSLEELTGIAALARGEAKPSASYLGSAVPSPVANAQQDVEEPLLLPVVNWAEKV